MDTDKKNGKREEILREIRELALTWAVRVGKPALTLPSPPRRGYGCGAWKERDDHETTAKKAKERAISGS